MSHVFRKFAVVVEWVRRLPLLSERRLGMPGYARRLCAVVLLVALPGVASSAADLTSPSGEVILTIAGQIEHTNEGGVAAFDRAMLEQLGLNELRTWTPWTVGEPVFEGVLAKAIMDRVGAQGTSVRATALNDYEVTIPVSDFSSYRVLVAMYQDGQELTKRERGPLWIVYPWTEHPELDDRPTRQKSIWQLVHLHVY